MNPWSRIVNSAKVIITAFGIVMVVIVYAIGCGTHQPWAQTLAVIGTVGGMVATLVNGIAKEDAATKAADSAIKVASMRPPPMPGPTVAGVPSTLLPFDAERTIK